MCNRLSCLNHPQLDNLLQYVIDNTALFDWINDRGIIWWTPTTTQLETFDEERVRIEQQATAFELERPSPMPTPRPFAPMTARACPEHRKGESSPPQGRALSTPRA